MKQILTLILPGLALAMPVAGRCTAAGGTAPDYAVTVTPAIVSQNMFRGQRLGGASLEPAIELDSGDWGAGLWANFLLSHQARATADSEIDPYAYYSFTLNGGLTLVPGFTLYTFQGSDRFRGGYQATFEPNFAVSSSVAGVRVTPKVYYDLVRKASTLELTGAYALPLKAWGTELDFTAQAGDYLQRDAVRHAPSKVKTWGQYWLVGVSAPVQITRKSRVTLGFSVTRGENAFNKMGGQPRTVNSLAVGRGVVTVNYSYTY